MLPRYLCHQFGFIWNQVRFTALGAFVRDSPDPFIWTGKTCPKSRWHLLMAQKEAALICLLPSSLLWASQQAAFPQHCPLQPLPSNSCLTSLRDEVWPGNRRGHKPFPLQVYFGCGVLSQPQKNEPDFSKCLQSILSPNTHITGQEVGNTHS